MGMLLVFILNLAVANLVGSLETYLTATRGDNFFTSTGYPASYVSDWDETWLITSWNTSDVIHLLVTDSEMEYSTECVYDFVKVYDGSSPSSGLLKQFCGATTPTIISTGSTLLVQFHSDSSVQRRGFRIKYWSELRPIQAKSTISEISLVIAVSSVVGSLTLVTFIVLIYYCTTKKTRARNRVAPTRVEAFNRMETRRGRLASLHYQYNTPRNPPSQANPGFTFFSTPGQALPDYATLYPTSPPPPYSECEQRAAP